MSVCNDVADYRWLTGAEAAALLDDLTASHVPLHTAIARLRNRWTPAQTHLLVEQVELRRRASGKFSAAPRMVFTRLGLEQATDEAVAHYKATRFFAKRAGASPPPVFADLCCGIGGDLLALAEQGSVVGLDCNPIAAHFARWNADSVLAPEQAARVAIHVGDVEEFDFDAVPAWHIDPDRRAVGRRTTSLDHCRPSLFTLERLLAQVPDAAIKLAPATNVPPAWAERCELEWISRGGECRQQVAWHGKLAIAPGLRRATVLTAGSRVVPARLSSPKSAPDSAVHTLTGQPNVPVPISERLDQFIFDIDPAIIAARLVGALAAEHGFSALSTGPTYLTASTPVADAAIDCFKVQEVLPLRVRALARYLRERHIGKLEIKKRGLDVLPEKLRRELKLRGENAATLLITPISGRPTAILAHRVG